MRSASTACAGPLSALAASHEHTAGPCAVLERLAQPGAGADPQAAARVLLHFDADAFGHQAREDLLFPLLLESMAGPDALGLRDMTLELARQHRALHALWAPLRLPLACMAIGACPPLDAAQVERFLSLYRQHLAREAQELLPLAARLFTDDELAWLQQRQAAQQPLVPYALHWH